MNQEKSSGLYTFDCWKPILHDDSIEPSKGMFLRDVVSDPRIKKVTVQSDSDGNLSQFVLENIWNESFHVEFFYLSPAEEIVAHAHQM